MIYCTYMADTQGLINELGTLSYVGIWGVSLLSNVVIPIPEEGVLLALGYLSGTGRVNGLILIPIVISALLTSDMIMYYLSKKGNKLISLFYNKLFASRLANKQDWMRAHIKKVIFFSRFLVQLRFIGPFMAGQMNVPPKTFILYDFLALLVYVPLFIFLGWFFHTKINLIIDGIGTVRNVILIVAGLLIALSFSRFVYRFVLGKQTEKKEVS